MQTVLRAFVDTATLFLKLWGVIIISAHFKKLVFLFLSLRNKLTGALERES